MDDLTETLLHIPGMTCGGCVRHVGEALRALPGVATADVLLEGRRARVLHDAGRAPPEALRAAVRAAGYEASTS